MQNSGRCQRLDFANHEIKGRLWTRLCGAFDRKKRSTGIHDPQMSTKTSKTDKLAEIMVTQVA